VCDGFAGDVPVTVLAMSIRKQPLNPRRPFLTLATLLFVICAAAPRVRAQVLDKTTPDLRAALLTPAPFPERLLSKPSFHPEWVPQQRPRSSRMSPAQRRVWLALGVAQHGAAFFDARTTRDAMAHYRELDPLLRPFAHSAAIYPAMQIAPLGLDWLARRLATSRHRWLRRLWWVPQAAATAGFLWSGMHNLGLPATPGIPTH
jgi:hypothetical protein